MKKTTSLKLTKQIAKYGALTAAIAGVADASGQIAYTNVDPDFMGGIGSEFLLDFNNDGTDDFAIRHNGSNSLLLYPLGSNNDFLGSGGSNYAYPYALSSGALVSSGATGSWLNNGFSVGNASLNYGSYSSNCSFGNWCDVSDRFLGLRFNLGGNTHYGWARLDVNAIGDVWSVKDFAYNTVADEAILTGQETLNLADNSLVETKIIALNKTIAFYNFPVNSEYKVFNLNGQQVLNGNIRLDQQVIEAQELSNGIYIIEISDSNNKAIRKKIVL